MQIKYYKKLDRSSFEWGVSITNDYIKPFVGKRSIKSGTSRNITVELNDKKYHAYLRHIDQKKREGGAFHFRWESNRELQIEPRKTFIFSYVILKSQKELFDSKNSENKRFRSDLEDGEQEVMIIEKINDKNFRIIPFIVIESKWNKLFRRLADENVFGWLFDKDKKYLIHHSSAWHVKKEFKNHKNATNVIYYLLNKKKRLLYIGKAENLGKRVKPGRDHQGMPGDWDMFRYDIVKPEYSNILERIEDHTIRSFASVLNNKRKFPTLGIKEYTLVNSSWKKL